MFDRLIFKGHLTKFFHPGSVRVFLWSQGTPLTEFGRWAKEATATLVDHAEALAAQAGRPSIYLRNAVTRDGGQTRRNWPARSPSATGSPKAWCAYSAPSSGVQLHRRPPGREAGGDPPAILISPHHGHTATVCELETSRLSTAVDHWSKVLAAGNAAPLSVGVSTTTDTSCVNVGQRGQPTGAGPTQHFAPRPSTQIDRSDQFGWSETAISTLSFVSS